MTRFVAPNLAGLTPPPVIEALDREVLAAARIADLAQRLTDAGYADAAATLTHQFEPLTIAQQTDASFELLIRQRINEAASANLIATASGASLDHLAATFYGVERLLVTPANPDATPPTEAVYEADDVFRARALLSLEARSTAGPEGGYAYFALQASADVADVAVYSEDDAAEYEGGDPVIAPEVLVVVLPRDGVESGAVPALLTLVGEALNAEEVRPIGDKVTVEAATLETYAVVGVIKHAPGADPAPLLAQATAQVQAYVADRRRVGRVAQRLGIGAAMKVTNVEEFELTQPALDVDGGSKGAPHCTSITLTAEVVEDAWR